MKRLFNSFAIDHQTRKIFIIAIYSAFLIFNIYNIVITPSIEGKISYFLLTLIILGIAIYAEYLRSLYCKMIKALTIEGDLAKALTLKMRLIKKDKLHNYQKSLLIFDTLYNLDCDQHQKNIDLLQANQRFFQGSLDYLLIRNYTYFISYYYLNNRSLLKTYYDKLLHLKDAKIKGQKVSPLYNWDLLEAIYQLALKNYRKSHTFFKNTDTTNLNNRELALYHLEYGRCLCKLQRYAQAKKQLQKCCETANTAIYKQKALDLLKQLTA